MESRGDSPPSSDLFTASEVARFCQVDLKTIHNWADKGRIPHFRTPGRHLRFRRLDLLDFLRRYGYEVPDALRLAKPRVVVIDESGALLQLVRRATHKRFELIGFNEPLDALVALTTIQPDAVVIDLDLSGLDGLHLLRRLRANEATSHIRVIAVAKKAERRENARTAGALDAIQADDAAVLRDTLDRHLGIEPPAEPSSRPRPRG